MPISDYTHNFPMICPWFVNGLEMWLLVEVEVWGLGLWAGGEVKGWGWV